MRTSYNIESIEGTLEESKGLISEVSINPDAPVFQGHFPSQPVIPGVLSIQILKDIICKYLERKIQFDEVISCKYLSQLDPREDNLLIYKDVKVNKEKQILSAEGWCGDKLFIKFKVKFS